MLFSVLDVSCMSMSMYTCTAHSQLILFTGRLQDNHLVTAKSDYDATPNPPAAPRNAQSFNPDHLSPLPVFAHAQVSSQCCDCSRLEPTGFLWCLGPSTTNFFPLSGDAAQLIIRIVSPEHHGGTTRCWRLWETVPLLAGVRSVRSIKKGPARDVADVVRHQRRPSWNKVRASSRVPRSGTHRQWSEKRTPRLLHVPFK
jgi:hypothetical protein